jgi:hypothetical protein
MLSNLDRATSPKERFPISTGPHPDGTFLNLDRLALPRERFSISTDPHPDGTFLNLDRLALPRERFSISTDPHPGGNASQSRPGRTPEGTHSNLDRSTSPKERFPITGRRAKTGFPSNHPPLPKEQRAVFQSTSSSRTDVAAPVLKRPSPENHLEPA